MTDDEISEFARRNGISVEQARALFDEHGHDDDRLAEAVTSLRHFLRAPS